MWVGMAYEFYGCTDPRYQNDVWRDAFKINFSKRKLANTLKKSFYKSDGSLKLSGDLEEIDETLSNTGLDLSNNYLMIVLLCLVAETLDPQKLADTLTSCLNDSKLNKGYKVEVKVSDKTVTNFTHIIIHVNTTTPQKIQIILKQK